MSATPDLRFESERERDTVAYALGVLRRRWLVVVAAVVLCLAAGVAIAGVNKSDRYESSTRVLFGTSTLSESALQVQRAANDPEREAATNVLLAGSEAVAANVRRRLALSTSVNDLLDKVQVEAEQNANVLRITATDKNPRQAAAIANAFAAEFVAFRARGDRQSIEAAQRDLQQQLEQLPVDAPERQDVRDALQRLASSHALANGDARVIAQAEVPTNPASPGLAQVLALAAIIGLALGVVGALVVESMDKRIADVASFEREYRLRALAVVPQKAFRRQGLRSGSGDLEPFRILRTAVDFARVTRPVRTVMVTSAVRGEGKTSVAIGLAQAIALSGRAVILVELDLRHPSLARTFGLADHGGVTSALLGTEPNDLLQRPLRELPDLEVLAAGVLPPNPAELLEAPALDVMLRSLLQDGKKTLVIDAAPLLPVADAQILLNKPAVDASVIVARQGVTTRDHARRARLVLDGHAAAPIGLVVTGHAARDVYGYGYGEIWQPEVHAEEPATSAQGAPRPAPIVPNGQPPRGRTRSRTRLSWLR
ncbi:MAG: tyrosine-protein kinase [Thermoleophilaceae bacterium]|jgi:capsular exopolysaccharide synthesis family protein|nr:tyrosine-protein kinase [Thermoleophilaceae bacterium]